MSLARDGEVLLASIEVMWSEALLNWDWIWSGLRAQSVPSQPRLYRLYALFQTVPLVTSGTTPVLKPLREC